MPSINCSVLGDWSLQEQTTPALSFGTNGVLAVTSAPTPVSLSFLTWETGVSRTLVTLNGSGDVITYTFTLSTDQYTLTVGGDPGALLNGTYSRLSGAPGPMSLSNPFVGACDAVANAQMVEGPWRWHFVPEGYVSTTHLSPDPDHGHSFINAYMVYPNGDDGVNYLFLLGQMWFGMNGGRLSKYILNSATDIEATETVSGVVWELTYATAPNVK
jgi:hypothetical protein